MRRSLTAPDETLLLPRKRRRDAGRVRFARVQSIAAPFTQNHLEIELLLSYYSITQGLMNQMDGYH